MSKNIAESIRAKLLNIAKAEKSDFNNVLIRFALERFLCRFSRSRYSNHFLLKGALLFTLWYNMPHRTTRDIDLLGFDSSDLKTIELIFHEIAVIKMKDGIIFDPKSVKATEIKKNTEYTGSRVTLSAELARAICRIQIDIGFGDVVTPSAIEATYPALVSGLGETKLKVYPIYTVISEKLHAIVLCGMTNSRLKDYFDLFFLISKENIDLNILSKAISATFNRRSTPLPTTVPIGLTKEFSNDQTRQDLWQAFLKKNNLKSNSLEKTVDIIRKNLVPALNKASNINI